MTPTDSAFTDTLISRTVRERIVLVGVTLAHETVADTEAGLDELALLVSTAGADVMDRVIQRRATPTRPPRSARARRRSCSACAWRSSPTPWSSMTN